MERLLLIFVRRLRQAGLSIGLGEVIDAGRALACLDVTDEQAVRTTLRSTLIKNACDFAVFDKVFELTFYVPDDKEQAEAGRLFPAFAVDGSGVGFAGAGSYRGELERVLENPEKLGSFVAELSSIIPLPDNCLDPDVLLHQVKVSLGWFMVKASLEKEKSADAKEKKQLLVQLQKEIKRRIERRLLMERGDAGLAAVVEKVALNTLDFVNLTDAQQHAVMQEVDKLAARFHQGFGRRFRPSRSPGQLDLRRTCRALMQRGRLPGSFRYKKKKPRPAKLVVLCDWSGSVRPYSMFLLRLVYALYQRFPSTSVFLFIDRIADITFYLDKFGFTEGLARALDEAVFSHTNNSDYGTVFYLFWRYYLQQLSKDTILLIYGDAKNLFKADERLFFAKIAEKAGKVFWLNPQPKEKWNTHDSIIKHYEPYCNAVVECGNLKQLRDAVELLK